MPNWASCALVVDHDEELLRKVRELPRNEDGDIVGLLIAFVPMPEVVVGVVV